MNTRIRNLFFAALAIGVAGLVVSGCSKSGSHGGGGGTTNNVITLTAELADTGAQPFELNQNQTRAFALVVKSNGSTLNSSDYTVNASSNNPTVATAGVDANKAVTVTAMSVVGLEATITATVGYLQASPVTVQFRVKVIGSGNSGSLTILIDQNTRTVNTNNTSPITVSVSENGVTTQLLSNQYNLELTNNASNIGTVQVLDANRWEFRASGNTGTCHLKVNVTNFNGKSGSKTFDNAFTVVTSGGGGGGGGGGSGGTANQVPGLKYTAITLATPGPANAGQGLQLTLTATRTDGTTTTNASDVMYDQVFSSLDFTSVDATGKVFFRRNSDTATVRAFQVGVQQTADASEKWSKVIWGNQLTVTSSATAATNLVMLKHPANPMVGERHEFMIWDCVSNIDVTSTATVTLSDGTVLQRVNNSGGQSIMLSALKTGTCTVSFTANGRSGSFVVRVIQFNPRIWTRNGDNVVDTHLRPGQPYVNPSNTLENMLPVLVNLEYCRNTAGSVVKTNPSLYRFVGTINGTTPVTPILRFTDENNQEWALFTMVYGGSTGTHDTENFQYVGNTRNPIDLSADNAWVADKQFSAGQSSATDNFRWTINKTGALYQVTLVTN